MGGVPVLSVPERRFRLLKEPSRLFNLLFLKSYFGISAVPRAILAVLVVYDIFVSAILVRKWNADKTDVRRMRRARGAMEDL
jgi:hypothetical protein